MKKVSFLLLWAFIMPCVHMFAASPIVEYADHTKVMKLSGGGGYKHKVIVLENPDSTLTISVISDPNNQITRESLRTNQGETFPYRDQLVHGARYKIVDNDTRFSWDKVATIRNGLDDSNLSEELTDNAIISTKEWVSTNNDAVYTLNKGGVGSVKYTISKNGYAQQVYDSRMVGSNQYRTKFKNQYYGGVTGGYQFVVEMTFSSKVEWFTRKTKEGIVLVVNQTGNPSVVSTKIRTSLDDDSSRKEWLKQDTKYNYEVNQAKESLMDRRPATFHGVVKAYKNQLIWLDNDMMLTSIKNKHLLSSLDNVEPAIMDYFKNEINNYYECLVENWKWRHSVNTVLHILEVMTASKGGDYIKDYNSNMTLQEAWNNRWKYYNENGNVANITSDNIAANANLIQKLNFVDSVKVVDIGVDSIVIDMKKLGGDTIFYYKPNGLYTCLFYYTNSLGYQTTKKSNVMLTTYMWFNKSYCAAAINKSFTYVDTIPGEYEYLVNSIKSIQKLEDSLRVAIPEEPVFVKFDNSVYKKYNLKLKKNHEDNKARIDKMLEYQRLLMTGINEYDSTIKLHQKILETSVTIPDVNKAYTKYFKSLKLIWEAGQPEINLANEREVMSGCVAFCNERNKIAENHQKILDGYSQYKNILKAYNTFYKGLNLAWMPGESTDKLLEAEIVQNAFISAISTGNLKEKDNAVKKSKDKTLNAILNIIK